MFLEALPEDAVGEMIVPPHSEALLHSTIGDKTLLEFMRSYTGLLIGDIGVADQLMERTINEDHRWSNGSL